MDLQSDEINYLKSRYDELLLEKKKYEDETKLKPNEIIIRSDKISKIIEIMYKTFKNDNLIKYLEFETKNDLSFKSLLNIEESKLDYVLKCIFDLGKKEIVKDTNANLNANTNTNTNTNINPNANTNTKNGNKKILLTDKVSKFDLGYKKPKPNKKLEFPSKIISLNQTDMGNSQNTTLSPQQTAQKNLQSQMSGSLDINKSLCKSPTGNVYSFISS